MVVFVIRACALCYPVFFDSTSILVNSSTTPWILIPASIQVLSQSLPWACVYCIRPVNPKGEGSSPSATFVFLPFLIERVSKAIKLL